MTAVDSTGARFRGALSHAGDQISVGSDQRCDWVVAAPGVADRHVDLVLRETDVWLLAHAPVVVAGRAFSGWEPADSTTELTLCTAVLSISVRPEGSPAAERPTPADARRRLSARVDTGTSPPDRRDQSGLSAKFALPPAPPERANGAAPVASQWSGPWRKVTARGWVAAAMVAVLGGAVSARAASTDAPQGSIRARPDPTEPTAPARSAPTPVVTRLPAARDVEALAAAQTPVLQLEAATALSRRDLWVARTRYAQLVNTDDDGTFATFLALVEARLRTQCTNPNRGWTDQCADLR